MSLITGQMELFWIWKIGRKIVFL